MMNAEFVNAIAGLAQSSVKGSFVDPPPQGSDKSTMFVPPGGGEPLLIRAEPPPRRLHLYTPEAVVGFVQAEKAAGRLPNPVLFVEEAAVWLLFDATDSREWVKCPLVPTDQFTWLKANAGESMEHADFIRALSITFKGDIDQGVLNVLKNLKFAVDTETGVVVDQGRASVSRRIEERVSGIGQVPDELSVRIGVFDGVDYQDTVECAIEIDSKEGELALTPFGGELRRVMLGALQHICDFFAKDGMPPVHLGSPWLPAK